MFFYCFSLQYLWYLSSLRVRFVIMPVSQLAEVDVLTRETADEERRLTTSSQAVDALDRRSYELMRRTGLIWRNLDTARVGTPLTAPQTPTHPQPYPSLPLKPLLTPSPTPHCPSNPYSPLALPLTAPQTPTHPQHYPSLPLKPLLTPSPTPHCPSNPYSPPALPLTAPQTPTHPQHYPSLPLKPLLTPSPTPHCPSNPYSPPALPLTAPQTPTHP